MADTANWLTQEFLVYNHSAQWSNVPGIYIFAGLNQKYEWAAFYVGQADNFQNRIPSHEKWESAQSLGATHVHAKVVRLEDERDILEKNLIQAYQPALNVQLK